MKLIFLSIIATSDLLHRIFRMRNRRIWSERRDGVSYEHSVIVRLDRFFFDLSGFKGGAFSWPFNGTAHAAQFFRMCSLWRSSQ